MSSVRRSALSSRSRWPTAGGTRSSASSQITQSPVHCSKEKLRAAAKSSTQGKRSTRAPACSATRALSSEDPVSTTTISSQNTAASPRTPGSAAASSLTIIASDRLTTRHLRSGLPTTLPTAENSDALSLRGLLQRPRRKARTVPTRNPRVTTALVLVVGVLAVVLTGCGKSASNASSKTDPNTLLGAALAAQQQGNNAAAKQLFQQVLDKDPKNYY